MTFFLASVCPSGVVREEAVIIVEPERDSPHPRTGRARRSARTRVPMTGASYRKNWSGRTRRRGLHACPGHEVLVASTTRGRGEEASQRHPRRP
jgi:hypothetical protein